MDGIGDTGKATAPERAPAPEAEGATPAPPWPATIRRAGAAGRRDRLRAQTTTLALVLLPVVLFLGIAAHGRLVEINREEVEPAGYEPAAARLPEDRARAGAVLHRPPRRRAGSGGQLPARRPQWPAAVAVGLFLVNTPTIVATVDAAVAAAIVVLVVRAAEAATTIAVVAAAVAFLVVWAALFLLQRRALDLLRRTTPRFPTPPNKA